MRNDLAAALDRAVDEAKAELREITDHEAGARPAPGKWSKKEELGHLIDSATNNHVRFVRASIEEEFRSTGYQQDDWVNLHGYSEMPWSEIVDFWEQYNNFLVGLVGHIPEEKLKTPCVVGNSEPVTLGFLIEDYVLHMQHHLDHIFERECIRQYPGAALGV